MKLISWENQNEIAKMLTANLIILESIYKNGEMDEECYEKCVRNTVNVLIEVCTLEMLIKCRNTLERRIRNDGKNTNWNQRMEAQSKI